MISLPLKIGAVVSGNNDIDVEPSSGTFDVHTEVTLLPVCNGGWFRSKCFEVVSLV